MNKLLIIISGILCYWNVLGQSQKFQVNGAARTYIFANELNIDQEIDSITPRNANYGHSLLDLGFSIFPNKQTEVIGAFRIRNELGGFWGGGVSFNVRQLTLKGVAGNKIRYELGDIDLSASPYTLFNNHEEGAVNENSIFSTRRDVVHYDLFYLNNSWRMQGAKASFSLLSNRIVQSINVESFLTRQNPSNMLDQAERLFGGFTVNVIKDKHLNLSIHSVNLFDLSQTITIDHSRYNNSANSLALNYLINKKDNSTSSLEMESGFSTSRYFQTQAPDSKTNIGDWFYDFSYKYKLLKHNITLGYKDVGSDYRAPGAQTKRMNFARSPALYQQISNAFIPRVASPFDFIYGNTQNSYKIDPLLMYFNPVYGNLSPYGMATPNRRGIYIDYTNNGKKIVRESFCKLNMLGESRGNGTNAKRNFIQLSSGTDFYINEWIKMAKILKLNIGWQYEVTTRDGADFEQINLSSSLLDAGLSYQIAGDMFLLLGLKSWSAKGNEFIQSRDDFNRFVDFESIQINAQESSVASGLQYNFNTRNSLSLVYELYALENKIEGNINYGISQFNLLFNLYF